MNKEKPRIILASASPRRKELLSRILEDFDIVPSRSTERASSGGDPIETAMENALNKALEVLSRFTGALVIGADTVVALEDRVMGKPEDADDAKRMLGFLSGRTHRVITGIAVVSAKRSETGFDVSHVTFRPLSMEVIERYVAEKKPLDKAGAYGIQEVMDSFVESLEGDYANVMGLPIWLIAGMLEDMNMSKCPEEKVY